MILHEHVVFVVFVSLTDAMIQISYLSHRRIPKNNPGYIWGRRDSQHCNMYVTFDLVTVPWWTKPESCDKDVMQRHPCTLLLSYVKRDMKRRWCCEKADITPQPCSAIHTRMFTNANPSMATIYRGGCYCGAIAWQATGKPILSAYCHCTLCQRLNGKSQFIQLSLKKKI